MNRPYKLMIIPAWLKMTSGLICGRRFFWVGSNSICGPRSRPKVKISLLSERQSLARFFPHTSHVIYDGASSCFKCVKRKIGPVLMRQISCSSCWPSASIPSYRSRTKEKLRPTFDVMEGLQLEQCEGNQDQTKGMLIANY